MYGAEVINPSVLIDIYYEIQVYLSPKISMSPHSYITVIKDKGYQLHGSEAVKKLSWYLTAKL